MPMKKTLVLLFVTLGLGLGSFASATTYYGEETVESNVFDAGIRHTTDGSFSSFATGNGEDYFNNAYITSQLSTTATTDEYNTLSRGFYGFYTTSPLSTGAAEICIYVTTLYNDFPSDDFAWGFYEGQPASANPAASDYQTAQSTLLTETRATSALSSSQYECWDLNAAGLTYLGTTSTPTFVLRTTNDATNSAPTWAASKTMTLQAHGTEQTGTDKDPYLATIDPRTNPVTTIVVPTDDDEYDSLLDPRYSVYTDVCYADYGSEDPTFDFVVEYWTGAAWAAWTSWSEDYSDGNGLLINNGSCLAYGIGDISQNPLIPDITVNHLYRIKARATFTATGSYTTENEFTVDTLAPWAGGGGGGSWDGQGNDDWDGWDTFFDGVPSHDTVYGACDFFSLASTQGDGLDCLWSWIQYAVWPPQDYLFDYITAPLDTLSTRWPFVYITNIISEVESGVTGTGTCPLPTLFGGTFLGQSVSSVNLCTWFSSTSGYFTANQSAEDTFEVVIWLVFAVAVFERAKHFLTS